MGRPPTSRRTSHGSYTVIDVNFEAQYNNCDKGAVEAANRRVMQYAASPRTFPQHISRYQHLEHMLESSDGFFETHRHFMLGRSFAQEFHTAIQLLFTRSPQILTDAYSATLELIPYRKTHIGTVDECGLTAVVQCLQNLTGLSLSITQAEDAAVVLMIGQILLVYHSLIQDYSTHTITRGSLLCVKEWYPTLIQRPDLHSITLTPVLVDTVECLFRREVPIIRLPTTDRCIVDRMLGVCSSLLPLLYDLCERSWDCKTKDCRSSSAVNDDDPYLEIECKINAWTPQLPLDFHSKYRAREVAGMLAQARLYRTAALLIIHRLRFPLGVEDETGLEYANIIFNELHILASWPPDDSVGFGLDFPLLVAMVEMPGPGVEMFETFERVRFRPGIGAQEAMEFIRSATRMRGAAYNGLWFDLVDNGLRGVLLP